MIEAKQLHKTYHNGDQETPVLNNVSLQIEKGAFVSIMGPSGSGKSTLLYILSGMEPPTAGSVQVDGQSLELLTNREISKLRRETIGMVYQSYHLIDSLTVHENLCMPLLIAGKPLHKAEPHIQKLLKLVGLQDRMSHKPRELSGGQQQRVAIARALVNQPSTVFADEPIGNLDSKSGTAVMELLRQVNQAFGTTIVQVTHSEEAATYGNRIIRLKDGEIQ